MKGISAVIATILMLMITIAMAGVAYMYISGIFTQQTGSITDIDESATNCAGTLGTTITVYVRNSGTIAFDKSRIKLSGTNSAGTPIAEVTCTAGTLNAGAGSSECGATITGSGGNNRIVVSGPSNTVTGSVYCPG
ncbi:MAG: archaellin/type IV pilin N-terminal domain-containing protein [Candidatus Aenigmatarchaeota archaeon]